MDVLEVHGLAREDLDLFTQCIESSVMEAAVCSLEPDSSDLVNVLGCHGNAHRSLP